MRILLRLTMNSMSLIESVEWPDIYTQTNGKITSARRDDTGELYLDVIRKYYYENAGAVIPQQEWDTGEYHDINR